MPVNCYIFICLLTFGSIFMSCFYKWNFPTNLTNWLFLTSFYNSFFTSLLRFIYIPAVCLPDLNIWIMNNSSFSLKWPYIYNFLIDCNNNLFLIVTRNAFLLPISGNIGFYTYITFWTNVFEGIIDINASNILVLSF